MDQDLECPKCGLGIDQKKDRIKDRGSSEYPCFYCERCHAYLYFDLDHYPCPKCIRFKEITTV